MLVFSLLFYSMHDGETFHEITESLLVDLYEVFDLGPYQVIVRIRTTFTQLFELGLLSIHCAVRSSLTLVLNWITLHSTLRAGRF